MATEYVDAGTAIPYQYLSADAGHAPPVVKGVAYDRIINARDESENWLTYYGAYDGQRYSPLEQINKDNVHLLTPAWMFQCGSVGLHAGQSTYAFEASPLVVDGVMFVSGWDGLVWALDAVTGSALWQYRHAIPFDVSLDRGNVNRGVAVAEGKVFMTTVNAHILALDAETGKKIWDQPFGDVRAGESATVAPLIVKDLVIVGSSGGEFGVRGHIDAFKLETGERVWRRYMIPKPGEPGSETWPADGEAWARGGANCWITPTFDPDLNLLYFGTGKPCPNFDGEVRAGDNLFTDCGVALDADSGEIKAHFQYTPHDVWGYDSTTEHILFDLDGQKMAAHFDKNGFLYILDRTNMDAIRVVPFVDRIDWGEVDEKGNVTPKVYPDKEGDPVHFWPGPAGAKDWTHACYSPKTELLYVPVQDVGATAARRRREFKESIPYWGAGVAVDADDRSGYVSAYDPRTAQERWRWTNDSPMCASLVATGGGLVFGGEPTGEFNAFDAETGEMLWRFQCGSGHHSSPCTYSVDGRQYIAVPTGWGAGSEGLLPTLPGSGHGSTLVVFALPEENGRPSDAKRRVLDVFDNDELPEPSITEHLLTLGLEGKWSAAEFAELLTALQQVYNALLALNLDRKPGIWDLAFISSNLRMLVPQDELEIATVNYASLGEISFRGSGEVIGETRKFVTDLATIDQKRADNKLELERKKQEIAEREAALQRQQQVDEIEISRMKRQNELELQQLEQQVRLTEIEMASQVLALANQMLEGKYGPDWRSVSGAQEEYAALVNGGNGLLSQLAAQRLLPPAA